MKRRRSRFEHIHGVFGVLERSDVPRPTPEADDAMGVPRVLRECRQYVLRQHPDFSHLWIIANANNDNYAWSGRQWVPIKGDVHICNFFSAQDALQYAVQARLFRAPGDLVARAGSA